MRRLLAATALLSALFVAAPSVQAADDVRLTCSDRPGWRFIDLQGWWTNRGDDVLTESQHVHAGACWPVTGTVSGTFATDVLVQAHNQPAGAYVLRARATNGSSGTLWSRSASSFGPIVGGELAEWERLTFSTSGLSSGFHEIRLGAFIRQPGGFDQFVSSGLPLQVRSISSSSRNYFEARGWYPNFLYTNGRIRSGIPLTAVPTLWQPTVQCVSEIASGALPVSDCDAAIDMNAHAGIRGRVIDLAENETQQKPIIDTSGLAGVHKLAILSSSSGKLGVHDGTNTGVIVLPFDTD